MFHKCNKCRICPKCHNMWCETSMPPISVTEEDGYIVKRCPDPECNGIIDKFPTLETLKQQNNMNTPLTPIERWEWLKAHHSGKYTIPWDRMSLPSHEWLDNYTTVYNTNIPLKIPKFRHELEDDIQVTIRILSVLYKSIENNELHDAILMIMKYQKEYLKSCKDA